MALLAIAGCHSLKNLQRDLPRVEATAAEQPRADAADNQQPAANAEPALLADDGWILARDLADDDAATPAVRWRHARLDAAMAGPEANRPDLLTALASDQPAIAANAAILLARTGSGAGLDVLARSIRSRELQPRQRLAAAEALGMIDEPSPAAILAKLFDEHNAAPGQLKATHDPDMQAELLRSYARHCQPADDPRFTQALESEAQEVRAAALDAWSRARPHTLPVAAIALRKDQTPQVRSAALRAIGGQQHPLAHEYLSAALRDSSVDVRLTAIAELGKLGGQDARMTLEDQLKDDSELIRAAVLISLAKLGSTTMLPAAVEDKTWRVRAAAAKSLGILGPSKAAVSAAKTLLADSSLQVQKQVVDSVGSWPLANAGPVLLQAIDEAPLITRQAAAAQLAARWPAAADFRADAPTERLAQMRKELHERWNREFGNVDRAAIAAAAQTVAATREGDTGSTEQHAWAVARLKVLASRSSSPADRRSAESDLASLGSNLPAVLQTIAEKGEQPIPDAVYDDVLPKVDPLFETLDQLHSGDLVQKRQVAAQLAEMFSQEKMPALAARRLADVVIAQQDALLWARALQAAARDSGPDAARMALCGLSHPAADVRRRACTHLGEHFQPQHCAPLIAALSDKDTNVLRAAVAALGKAGTLPDTKPIAALLTATDKSLRIEAALALTNLRAAEGPAALERLAFDPDLDLRRQAATAMGTTADPQFIGTLVRLLDDRADVSHAALQSLEQLAGPDGLTVPTPSGSPTQQIERWKQWWSGVVAGG